MCEQSNVSLELGRLVIPPYFWGSFFSRHGVWLISSEEAGAGEVACGEEITLWLLQSQAVSPGLREE